MKTLRYFIEFLFIKFFFLLFKIIGYKNSSNLGGKIGSFGSDAVESPMTKNDIDWLTRKLKVAEIGNNFDVYKMTKIVSGKKLWNYDNLEPTERKGAI